MVSREDAESNRRLVEALFGSVSEAEEALVKDKSIPSHQQLDYNEDGEPSLLRFVYVDEPECIGCTYCADVARNTFFMEEGAGRARAFAQGGDDPEVVLEAIDCCPVNCISFVDLEDLTILETERDGETINQRSAGLRHGDRASTMNRREPTKAKLSSGMMCCNNCPSKGCKECPMYGVGQNPLYKARVEARLAKQEASGEAKRAREEDAKALKVWALFEEQEPSPIQPDEDAGLTSSGELGVDVVPAVQEVEEALDAADVAQSEIVTALFADSYGGFETLEENS